MPRHTRPKKQLLIRFKDHTGLPKSSLVFATGTKGARDNFGSNKVKVLRVGKVQDGQFQKVGEYNDMPKRLMAEFASERRKKENQRENSSNPIQEQA
jgi:hypothetical protein